MKLWQALGDKLFDSRSDSGGGGGAADSSSRSRSQ